MNNKYISIGKITNFHGINGEVKVGYTKGKDYQIIGEKSFFVKNEDETFKELKVSKIRFHKNFAIIKFQDINSIDEALVYKGCAIYTPVEKLRDKLEEDEFLIDDLVNVEVYSLSEEFLGKVAYVNKQSSSDLLSIKKENGQEFMVPFVKELVPVVDLENNKIYINAIEGLID